MEKDIARALALELDIESVLVEVVKEKDIRIQRCPQELQVRHVLPLAPSYLATVAAVLHRKGASRPIV